MFGAVVRVVVGSLLMRSRSRILCLYHAKCCSALAHEDARALAGGRTCTRSSRLRTCKHRSESAVVNAHARKNRRMRRQRKRLCSSRCV
eukprot:466175-Pleurochrysis_carterae.AAC.1